MTKTSTKSDQKKPEQRPGYLKSGPVDIIRHRFWYILVSLALLIPGTFFVVLSMMTSPTHSPVLLGIDFTGGTLLQYGFERRIEQADLHTIRGVFETKGYAGPVIQIEAPRADIKTDIASLVSIRTKQLKQDDHSRIEADLKSAFGSLTLLQKNSIGPTMANELLVNGILALFLAYILIVGYLSFRFQFDYAVCAIVALVHDTLFVFGVYAALGYFYHVEVDGLFVTAILTVVGFSVHDTIVVFDRLRENSRLFYSKKLPFGEIANMSINQTLARSINTSVTALLPLSALYFLGGETTQNFVLALILGIFTGTYSSICVASLMLVWWRERNAETAVVAAR